MVRACFFDASALVKVYAEEIGSDVVRGCFNRELTKYTTPFCFYETLTALKRKWLKTELTLDAYRAASYRLTLWYGASSRCIKDIEITSYEALPLLKHLITTYEMDVSDAFQIISVKHGYYHHMCGESQTLFVTADERLAEVATKEGLLVQYVGGATTLVSNPRNAHRWRFRYSQAAVAPASFSDDA